MLKVMFLMYKISSGEVPIVIYKDIQGNDVFLMSRKSSARAFYLYKIDGERAVRLGRASSPTELEYKFNVIDEMGEA